MSELEEEVMAIIWNCTSCTVRDVMKKLSNKKLAYTTVATILYRLYEKGIVIRKGQGISFIYSPKLSKESYSKKIAKSFIKTFVHSFGDVAIASFAQSIEILPKAKREYFLKLLDTHDISK